MEDGMIRESRTLRVCVLAGGDSPERDISLASGRSVARSLVAAGHNVSCIDPRPAADSSAQIECRPGTGVDIASADTAGAEFQPAVWHQIDWRQFDACFLALHGGAGEDGRLQQFLELHGVAFTGPSAEAARTAMSKSASKARFRAASVPTPQYEVFLRETGPEEIGVAAARVGYPLIAKPDAQGSSLGVVRVTAAGELESAVAVTLRYDSVGILEAFIEGREFTVAVLDREPLPLVEVCSREPVFSFAEKYDSSAPHYRFEFELPARQQQAIVDAAVAAAAAIDTSGLVRIDLRLDTLGQPWVLELNSIPGMTETSLAPAAARRAGLEMPALCSLLLDRCLKRKNRV
jgi:D-alanine-D-alanine ligase